MKILGIDPGIARTGWGIVEETKDDWKASKFGCITTQKHQKEDQRLANLYAQLQSIISENQPDEAAIEKLFFNTNAKTAMMVGQARGVSVLAFSKMNVPIEHYTPLQIKIAMTGYGRAEKRQIQQMVKTLLKLDSIPKPDDTADALAVALTHAYSRNTKT